MGVTSRGRAGGPEGHLTLVIVGTVVGLAIFAVLPQWVFYREWVKAGDQVLEEKIAAWAIFALAAAACPALTHRAHATASGVALILATGVVSIIVGMFVYAETSTVDMIGPITALASAGGGLLSVLLTGTDLGKSPASLASQ